MLVGGVGEYAGELPRVDVEPLGALKARKQQQDKPPRLPSLDASGYPPYRPVFVRGECDANDIDYSEPTARINTNKTCFTCFRIPTLVRIPGTGTILVFAEARRTQLDVVAFHGMTAPAGDSCPDAPDTRIVLINDQWTGATRGRACASSQKA